LGPDKFKLNGNSSITPESVSAAIFRAVDTLNETLAETQQPRKSRDTVLIDTKGSVDSMALVNLIVFVEDRTGTGVWTPARFDRRRSLPRTGPETLSSIAEALCRKLAA